MELEKDRTGENKVGENKNWRKIELEKDETIERCNRKNMEQEKNRTEEVQNQRKMAQFHLP